MSRKHSLSELVSNGSDSDKQLDPSTKSRADYVRRGASKAMKRSLVDIAEDAKLVAAGDMIVELDPDKVDESFFVDRLDANPEDDAALEQAIARDGYNSTPILVRPHPKDHERYMIVFGHRRWRVAKRLGIKVRAVIKSIEDIGHIIAQGQENTARSNLSFIEKAMAAAKLESMGQSRETIKSALSVDDALASRMLSVANTIDPEVVFAIGPAKRIGRDRWDDMKRLVANPKVAKEAKTAIGAPGFDEMDSNDRFEFVLKSLKDTGRTAKSRSKASVQKSQWQARDESLFAEIQRSNSGFQLKLKSDAAGEFGQFLARKLDELFEEYQTEKGRGDD